MIFLSVSIQYRRMTDMRRQQ